MEKLPVKILAVAALILWPCVVFGDDDGPYGNGIAAYKRQDYRGAYDAFHQAGEPTKQEAAYNVWLGSTCKMIYDSDPKPGNLPFLLEGAEAYRAAFQRTPDLHLQYNGGRMRVLYAIESARTAIEQEFVPVSAEAQPGVETPENRALLKRQRETTLDSVRCFLAAGEKGLDEIWDTVIEQERRERPFVGVSRAVSDTLEQYLTFYAENAVGLLKTIYPIDFNGLDADYFIPKIAAACRRGERSSDPQWFQDLLTAIQFDGGHNMRAAICRLKALDFGKEDKVEQTVEAFQKAIRYARSDSSVASLYSDLAHAAYKVDLHRAVAYDRMALDKAPLSQVVRDNYVGHSLNLALDCLDQGRVGEAITAIQAVTLFRSNYQAEAFARLAMAYLKSSLPDAHARAVAAAREAYRLDAKYKKEYRDILVMLGRLDEALLLDAEKEQPAHPKME